MDILNAGRMLRCQREFVAERQWEKFHTPKNLSMVLTIEAAELILEEGFWSKMRQNRAKYPVRLARGNAKKHEAFLRGKGLHRRRTKKGRLHKEPPEPN